MQIHNHGAGQTLFAFNEFHGGGQAELCLGNAPSGQPDWTFNQNTNSYSARNLQVWVRPSSFVPGAAVPLPAAVWTGFALLAGLAASRRLRRRRS